MPGVTSAAKKTNALSMLRRALRINAPPSDVIGPGEICSAHGLIGMRRPCTVIQAYRRRAYRARRTDARIPAAARPLRAALQLPAEWVGAIAHSKSDS